MVAFNILVLVSLLYVVFLFAVAFLAERHAAQRGAGWLRSPLVYTLSLSIYCTAWTFYGAVGYAARSGMEYVTIYLGPSLVMLGWWWMLRKLVRIGRRQRITSIADLISSRFGKSPLPGVVVTVIAVAGITPYIALQLQSITLSFDVFADSAGAVASDRGGVALGSAMGLALFTILFGTRNLDANERHHGVVMAIAVEAVVKLAALIAVGVFVVWGLGGGLGQTLDRIDASPIVLWDQSAGRWIGLTFVSAAAFLCLPRMFHVLVVENADERQIATASWAFPLYVMAMSLFVVPIAVIGLELMPPGANPDTFVLTLPLHAGADGLAMLSFLGGFSSATSMVIVATIALATMVSNHIVAPLWLAAKRAEGPRATGDMRSVLLNSRRIAIGGLLGLGYVYYRLTGGGEALSAIGLIAFAGLVQILPAMIGGLYWRGATRFGAAAGLMTGFVLWLWTLFLPSFGPDSLIPAQVLAEGPWGLDWLRPQSLFGTAATDPLMHSVFWSLSLNTLLFVTVSLVTFPSPLERLQGAQFVNVFDHGPGTKSWTQSSAPAEDLLAMSQRILGFAEAQELFRRMAAQQGKAGYLPAVTPAFLGELERELSGSVGAATAHAMIGQIAQGVAVSVEDLIAVADEAAQILEYSSQLEAKSQEQELTALALRDANDKLTRLSHQKDAFLSQISHELRTPMTSIRAFSEILREGDLAPDQTARYAGIIEAEAQRLTRLLDDLLDLSVLENGQVRINRQLGSLRDTIDRAAAAAGAAGTAGGGSGARDGGLAILRRPAEEGVLLHTDLDRLAQVFINLIANARKYCDADQPELRIATRRVGGRRVVDFIDNGSGIAADKQDIVFEKFTRLTDPGKAGGAGLGLAICREIMLRLGGEITYLPGQGGAAFRVTLPQLDPKTAD